MYVWDFHSGNLLEIIRFFCMSDYCLWNENYLFITTKFYEIYYINIENFRVITKFDICPKGGMNGTEINTIKMKKYGDCLICTHPYRNAYLDIWTLKK